MAVKPIKWKGVPRFYVEELHRVEWKRIKDDLPKSYTEYWLVFYEGKHVADFFKGKSKWYAVVFGRFTIRGNDVKALCLHISGAYAHRGN